MNWTEFASNPWVSLAGTLFGVIGIVISIVFFLRSRKVKRPTYYSRSMRWFDGKQMPHDELTLLFRGRPISRFTITHIAFWNGGNDTFRALDFAKSSPLRLVIPNGVEVFDIRIIARTTESNGTILDTPTSIAAATIKDVPIQFDYFDPNDGFLLQIIHDGGRDQRIEIAGKLPGVSKFEEHIETSSSDFVFDNRRLRSVFSHMSSLQRFLLLPLAFFALGSLGPISIYYAYFKEFHWYHILGFFCTLYLAVPFSLWREPIPPKALCELPHQEGGH